MLMSKDLMRLVLGCQPSTKTLVLFDRVTVCEFFIATPEFDWLPIYVDGGIRH
jgi:hypothetical protein